ncbi:alpha/beta hydrolase [Gilvibacter sediminis]|uniref:alpha/beta hydrolase n=1 Tax=Gilvibacter sediminis TaxID=379071 RepID=UPI0023508FAD|nr:alpha/beta hydrolase-fold protein [Gilvibacter sediminis]MDC7998021.1 alpha/beta hydrolase-fold protein [Gilvibacter sediminis]
MKPLHLILLLLLGFGKSFALQDDSPSKTYTHELISEAGNEYLIKVTTPPDYSTDKQYATLYYLDAWWLEDLVNGTYNVLNYSQNMEPVILVGISLKGNERDFNAQRTRDYTPTPFDMQLMKFPFSIPLKSGVFEVNEENSGGATLFRKFLKDKVFEVISSSYAVNENKRGFLGHSFGGLFGVYELFKEDSLFTDYIVIAPALWWNKSEGLYESLTRIQELDSWSANLYICYGALNDLFVVKWTDRFVAQLESNPVKGLNYKFVQYPEDDHVSVLPKAIYDGLQFLFLK